MIGIGLLLPSVLLVLAFTLFPVGYNVWLDKLNSFKGDFIQAEMVKAFIASPEYRKRFGP